MKEGLNARLQHWEVKVKVKVGETDMQLGSKISHPLPPPPSTHIHSHPIERSKEQ